MAALVMEPQLQTPRRTILTGAWIPLFRLKINAPAGTQEPSPSGDGYARKESRIGAGDLAATLVILLANCLLFATSPKEGAFWWSDAPRHALNGAFFYDLFRTLPLSHLKEFAVNYYFQYPALTILFYPPAFAIAEALVFRLLGVSHQSAQLTVALFTTATSVGIYALCRGYIGKSRALATVLAFLGLPEVGLWGRQVMLELPAYAFMVWSVYTTIRYRERRTAKWLYLTCGLILAGAYTKQTSICILPLCAAIVYTGVRGRLRKSPGLLGSIAMLVVGLLPLAYITLKFGSVNVDQVVGGEWNKYSLTTLAGWLYYLRMLPRQTGWTVCLSAAAYLIITIRKTRLRRFLDRAMLGWFLLGYIFFTCIALKEERHSMFILLPFAYATACFAPALIPGVVGRVAGLAIAAGLFGHMIVASPAPQVDGYRAAVNFVLAKAPQNAAVLFSGYQDGSFIFNMRTRRDRSDVSVIRADKLLLDVAVKRAYGVKDRGMTEAALAELILGSNISHVVIQPNYWDDLPAMQRLRKVLKGPAFTLLARLPITGNVTHRDQELEVYEVRSTQRRRGAALRFNLPIVGLSIEGSTQAKHEGGRQ
jgi:hypothetical protein